MKKIAVIILLTVSFIVLALESWIWFDMYHYSKMATKKFHQDRTTSLLALIDSPDFSLKQKNMAVWTLGVLKDEKALPKLESMVTGGPCHHQTEICQYELKKAILKTMGEYRWSKDVKYYSDVVK